MSEASTSRSHSFLRLSTASAVLLGAPALAHADYRLVFTSADGDTATSSNISDYNTFVTDEANLNPNLAALGTTWTAIVSTPSEDALTNISCAGCDTLPLYLVNGTLLADQTSALFLGAGTQYTTLTLDQFGNDTFGFNYGAWTGSNPDGTAMTGSEMSTEYPALGLPIAGPGGQIYEYNPNGEGDYSIYAISGDITGDPSNFSYIPEPASGSAILLGGLVVTAVFRRGRRRTA